MPTVKPAVCLVLHAHMPYVLKHGHWPHGEVWLMEAAVGVYLPLIGMLQRLSRRKVSASFSLGLTPILLLQLADKGFQARLLQYIDERLERAAKDHIDSDICETSKYWFKHYQTLKQLYSQIKYNIPQAFAKAQNRGQIEILSGPATHPYAALLTSDRTLEHQIRVGRQISKRILGKCSSGIWLPECSHRPQIMRRDPISGGQERLRYGVDRILERCGVSHFFVESDLFDAARSEGVVKHGVFHKTTWDAVSEYQEFMWRSVLEPHRVNTMGKHSRIVALARHPEACAQVWSADGGYPGDSAYLEFHKRKDTQGHRYWRVTDRGIGLGGKKLYHPASAGLTARAHAVDYLQKIESWLSAHPFGRPATLTLCFDAELFGHWWFEGPQFLEHLLHLLGQHSHIDATTADRRIRETDVDKVVWLGEGSWGAEGDHRVWWNDQSKWMWQCIHRAEHRFHQLSDALQAARKPTQKAIRLHKHLSWAFLLLQSSDWIFVITTKGAVDYGYQRFCEQLSRFDALAEAVEFALMRKRISAVTELKVKEAILMQPNDG